MARPRLERQHEGLTRTEVAKQLRCSYSNVRRLQEEGILRSRKDRDGIYRFDPYDVAEAAKRLGRDVALEGERVARLYERFLAPGFKLTTQALARIVVETREHPDVVVSTWERFRRGAPSAEERSPEVERLAHEYDEQIAAMDRELARKRRGAFIAGDPHDEPPGSR